MNSPLFSILIAQYNNGKYFKDCYNSIISQTYTNWEVIIVDDCSSDDSLKIMHTIIGDDLRFKIYQNAENKGCGYTKKRCIDAANGEICGILDADDYLHCEALENVVQQHIQKHNASIVYTSTVYFDTTGILHNRYRKTVQQPENVSVIEQSYVSHFVTFKTMLYQKSHQVNPVFQKAVDLDLYIVLEEVGDIFHLDRELYYHRMHEGGISQAINSNAPDWAFLVKNYHSIRKNSFDYTNFDRIKKWYQYDLSLYSSWHLFKVIVKRLVG